MDAQDYRNQQAFNCVDETLKHLGGAITQAIRAITKTNEALLLITSASPADRGTAAHLLVESAEALERAEQAVFAAQVE